MRINIKSIYNHLTITYFSQINHLQCPHRPAVSLKIKETVKSTLNLCLLRTLKSISKSIILKE